MHRSTTVLLIVVLLIACLASASASAADLGISSSRHHRVAHHRSVEGTSLPGEHHVIEVAAPPYSGAFIINGTSFRAQSGACLPWTAGEPVNLLAGDWHGRCDTAIFYNLARHRSCRMWCGQQQAY